MLGGYLLLMIVVILYYYLVARVGGAFIKSAFTGSALLIALVTPVFAAASWLTEHRRARVLITRERPGKP
jgi:high-affinity Fe2+/Pb2+ permease